MAMVCARLGLPEEQVLHISKVRVGAAVEQTDALFAVDVDGTPHARAAPLPDGSQVLIADDFTNSGSTLLGGAAIVRKRAGAGTSVSAYVSHIVAKYDRSVLAKFVAKLYGEGGEAPVLDAFYCTDSVSSVSGWLAEEVQRRQASGKEARAIIVPLAPTIAEWIRTHPPGTQLPPCMRRIVQQCAP